MPRSKAKPKVKKAQPVDDIDFSSVPIPSPNNSNSEPNMYNILSTQSDLERPQNRNKPIKEQDPLSDEELSFLAIYLPSELSLNDAMIQAGYGHLNRSYRETWARRAVRRYEAQAGDARKVFRDVGLGEVEVARRIRWLVQHGVSQRTQISALELAQKGLRLSQDPGEQRAGINIIINTAPQTQTGSGSQAPGPVEVEVKRIDTPKRPLQITE